MITELMLRQVMRFAPSQRLTSFALPIETAMRQFGISTPARIAAFIAQVAHESGELRYTLELASGEEYEGRADLGNTHPGDGIRFKGRGLIQITGKANYIACGAALGLDLVAHPELIEAPAGAALSAGWFWSQRGLNELADTNQFGAISKRINGGFNGIDSRISYWLAARRSLGIT